MIQNTLFAFRHLIYWLTFFTIFRLLALIISWDTVSANRIGDIIGVFYQGIRLDISTLSYLFIVPILTMLFLGSRWHNQLVNFISIYGKITTFILAIFSIASLVILKFWGTLLNLRALEFTLYPEQMLASVTNLQILIIFSAILFVWFSIEKYRKWIMDESIQQLTANWKKNLLSFLVLLPITFLSIRGGLTLIPVNEASAAYSKDNRLNNIALNPIWYLGNNIYRTGLQKGNPYEFMDDEQAKLITQSILTDTLLPKSNGFIQVSRPNLVLIILESWTADLIEPLGGEKEVTPFFNELCKEGLLFTNVYSSGFRTDQGLTSILSGFPALPNKSIIKFIDKTASLPSIGTVLKSNGYETRFQYGGELGFANMNNYLLQSGFENRISIDDFETHQKNSKWGAHDEHVLNRALDEIGKSKKPFFNVILTLSSHEPFESPIATPFKDHNESEKFKGSAWYTDKCLSDFFENAKKTDWYENTLFVLVADHGHRLPRNRDFMDPAARRIPLLLFGPVLQDTLAGKRINKIVAQHDLPATLLWMLQNDNSKFTWSKNMFGNPTDGFAFINQDHAITWVVENGARIIPLNQKSAGTGNGDELKAKAYIQHLFRAFLEL